ncbi:putative cytochrome P450 monooxygenase [Hypoxylon sp. NC0597]|nr:putative cytochrome P450 monooxygenase [Hypoxylon sp. NC0597]
MGLFLVSSALIWPMLLIFSTAVVYKNRTLRNCANDIISALIDKYLLWRFPVHHQDNNRQIPTCPYRFPNGQGDIGKFLDGIENSEIWEKSHGHIYRIWSGMRPEIVLTRPEHLRNVFKDSDKHFKAVNNNSGYFMSQLLGKCVGLISGEEWKSVRTCVEHPFLRKSAAEYVPLVKKHIKMHFDELWQYRSLSEELLDPAEDLKLLPFWIVAEVFYGQLTPAMMAELREMAPEREALFKEVIKGGISRFSFSRYLPTKANQSLANFLTRWRVFNNKAYELALASGITTAPIVQMYELVRKGTMTSDQLLQTLDESLFANLDVTTGGISWNLIFLAAYQHYQGLLVQEHVERADKEEQYILDNSSLLAACISESSRLRPLAAFSVPQSAPTERVVDGYVIPAGTDFIVDSYGLNIRNDFWGSDTAAYRPERFLEKGALELRYHFWRFGFGPRQCMGRYVADIIIRTLIIHLVENYELSIIDPSEKWGRNPETWINHPQMRIRCVRKQ